MKELDAMAYLYIYNNEGVQSTDEQIVNCATEYARDAGIELTSALTIVRGVSGKPFLRNKPAHFSVSHSGDIWSCAFSDQPIGLDIQQRVPCNRQGVARRFFHPDEHAHLENNGYRDFFDIWVAKESYVKYTGQGIDDDFDTFSVVQDGKILTRVHDAYFVYIHSINGYSACVCSAIPVQVVTRDRRR